MSAADRDNMNDARWQLRGSKVELKQAAIQYLKKSKDIQQEIREFYDVSISFREEKDRKWSCMIDPSNLRSVIEIRQYITEKLVQMSYSLPNFERMKAVAHSAIASKLWKENLHVGWYFDRDTQSLEICGNTEEDAARAYQLIASTENRDTLTIKRSYQGTEIDHGVNRKVSNAHTQQQPCDDLRHTLSRPRGSKTSTDDRSSPPPPKLSKREEVEAALLETATEQRTFRPEVLSYVTFENGSLWVQIQKLCSEKRVRIVEMDCETSTITLEGKKIDIAFVFTQIKQKIDKCEFVNSTISKLFQKCYTSITTKEVEALLKAHNLSAGWNLRNGRLYVCSDCNQSAERAMQVIRDLIVDGEYPAFDELSPDKIAVTKERKWNSFVDRMRIQYLEEGLQLQHDDTTKRVHFVLRATGDACAVIKALDKFFEPYNRFQETIELEQEIKQLLLPNLEFVHSSANDVKIEFKGSNVHLQSHSQSSLKQAMEKLQLLIDSKSCESVSYMESSFEAWLRSKTGKDKLADICTLTKTISSINQIHPNATVAALKKIHVDKGDISAVEADGIVSSQGIIASVIQAKNVTGIQLHQGLQTINIQRGTWSKSTVQVYHMQTEPWDNNSSRLKQLGDSISQAYSKLQGSKVIAIPAIGTGALNYPGDKVATVMIGAVLDCLKQAPADCAVEKVIFVINPSAIAVYKAFDDELQIHKLQVKRGATVTFTGLQKERVQDAVRRLNEDYKQSTSSANWSNPPLKAAIKKLTQAKVSEICDSAAAQNIEMEFDQVTGKIELHGLKDDVDSLKKRIDEMLWKQSTASEANSGFPSHWDQLANGSYEVELNSSSAEYNQVASKFRETTNKRTLIAKITRIQNEPLYMQYKAQKSKVTKELGGATATTVERALWHGTTAESVKQICANEFNRSYAGKNATMYGIGSYFSTTSDYSIHYCTDNVHKRIILAKVATGHHMVGTQTTDRKSLPQGYHSTVNDQSNPTIFVVYHDAAAYPEYVIQFRLQ